VKVGPFAQVLPPSIEYWYEPVPPDGLVNVIVPLALPLHPVTELEVKLALTGDIAFEAIGIAKIIMDRKSKHFFI
jgi:hypothetical protein